jgi:hypothetical protein
MPFNNPPWHPITDARDLKTLGKLGEECGELSSVIARCIIQGVNEIHPVTNYQNRCWLEDEIADVEANIKLVKERFRLDCDRIKLRAEIKCVQLDLWHREA